MVGVGKVITKIQDSGLIPDSIASVSILSACSHTGLSSEGRHYYRLMSEEYKIVPKLEHCACMVNLFVRAGRVEEAQNFISQMQWSLTIGFGAMFIITWILGL